MGIFSSKQKEYTPQEIEFEITNLQNKIASTKVNHILHLLLCIPTAGLWLIAWILVVISASSERTDYEKKLKEFYKMKGNLETKMHKEVVSETLENNPSMDSTEKLIKLSNMLEKGLITEQEFNQQKEKLFNQ